MPIVSRRSMAMNESIAATCCFRMVVSPTNIFNEVLHGGYIKSGPEKILQWDSSISQDWSQLDFDVDFSAYTGQKTVPVFNSLKREWWVLFFAEDRYTAAVSMESFLHSPDAQVFSLNPGCQHDSDTCRYLLKVAAPSNQNHVDSAEAHFTDGGDWRQPHAVLQFNS